MIWIAFAAIIIVRLSQLIIFLDTYLKKDHQMEVIIEDEINRSYRLVNFGVRNRNGDIFPENMIITFPLKFDFISLDDDKINWKKEGF